jgi:outer membrane protein assembly factor BamE (lipoprotein component of BamABCDE complex)
MRPSRGCQMRRLAGFALVLSFLQASQGCGPAALMVMTVAGGAAAVSGEPQRIYGTQGQDFDEQRVDQIRSGTTTPTDVVHLLGNPQTKTFTQQGEEWAYRYFVPPTMLRSGMEKILTIQFREGKVQGLRYSNSAL